MEWPAWWQWELEVTPHLERRMEDRDFTETDLRTMLDHATSFDTDTMAGRFVVETRHARRAWRVVIEPDEDAGLLVVITAYPTDR
jgi:hypothetical protein